MTRVMMVYTLLFLLPFILFGGWRWLVKGARGRQEIMSDAPILVLFFLGISLVAAGLYFLASHEKFSTEGRYHPPVINNGQIEPGYFESSGAQGN